MASARLQITVESACNLHNSDGRLAGKSDPYVIVEVPGQEGMKFQTGVISNELNPVWNFTGEIAGFMDGDILRFTVMDKDTFPKPDDFLGKTELMAQDFYPHGFHGELMLADSKTQATLSVMIAVVGCDEADPQMVEEAGGVQVMDPGNFAEGTMMAGGSSSAAVYSARHGHDMLAGNSPMVMHSGLPAGSGFGIGSAGPAALSSGAFMHGLQVYNPDLHAPSTTASQSMTYAAPQASMNGMAMQSIVGSQSMAPQSMASQSLTYAAPQAAVPSQAVAATGKVVVHPPRTVSAEEFAKINGVLVSEPLPVTVGIETVGVETNREVVVNDVEAMDKTVKIRKKKKTKKCC